MALAIASVIVPTVFDIEDTNAGDLVPISKLSRGVAIILLLVYAAYLYFQLSTHRTMYSEESKKVPMRPRKGHVPAGGIQKALAAVGGTATAPGRYQDNGRPPNDELLNPTAYEEADNEPDEPQLHLWVAIATLAISTVIIALCAEYMVDSITGITESGALSEEFVGLILLPIVGNAAEHATAVTVACKDKMDLAIGVAIGSSLQIALLVIPFAVILGWILGDDSMTLSFDGFQVAVLFVAVLLVNYLIADGKSHWLEGVLLQALYIIIAVCAWFYPATGVVG